MTGVRNPEDIANAFNRAFDAHDLDGLLNLYDREGVLYADAATPCRGREAIAAKLNEFFALPGRLASTVNYCVSQGDIALLRVDWRIIGPDGNSLASGSSAEVLRRQQDGSWRYLIDHAVGASLPRAEG